MAYLDTGVTGNKLHLFGDIWSQNLFRKKCIIYVYGPLILIRPLHCKLGLLVDNLVTVFNNLMSHRTSCKYLKIWKFGEAP